MKDNLTYFLNPDNFKIEDRNLEEFILFFQNLSKNYQFFNLKNKADGDWFKLFIWKNNILSDFPRNSQKSVDYGG